MSSAKQIQDNGSELTYNAEHLFLIVQNDGNGNQCGVDYKTRCALARGSAKPRVWLEMAMQANAWLKSRDYDIADSVETLQAAAAIAEYYIQHVKE